MNGIACFRYFVFLAIAGGLCFGVSTQGDELDGGKSMRLSAKLSGPTKASGAALYEMTYEKDYERRWVSVQFENANPGMTVVVGVYRGRSYQPLAKIGVDKSGRADLTLDSRKGHSVPRLMSGDWVVVETPRAKYLVGELK